MSAFSTDTTAGTAGTTTDLQFDTGATTLGTGALAFTSSGSSSWSYEDQEAFETEWKKFRSEFLQILLRDEHLPIKHFTMRREMDMKTKETTVHLQISFVPHKSPKKGVRSTV